MDGMAISEHDLRACCASPVWVAAVAGSYPDADALRRAARTALTGLDRSEVEQVLTTDPATAEVRLSLPNKHHFLSDLTPFGLDNPGEVCHAADRPYGLIEGTVLRDDAPPAGPAWD